MATNDEIYVLAIKLLLITSTFFTWTNTPFPRFDGFYCCHGVWE